MVRWCRSLASLLPLSFCDSKTKTLTICTSVLILSQEPRHSALTTAALGLFCLSIRTSGIMTRHSTPMSHATSMYDSTLAWVITECGHDFRAAHLGAAP